MIRGHVNALYEAVVTLMLRGPTGQTQEIEAIVDTGSKGSLTVTPAMVTAFDLPFQIMGRATLADGRETTFPMHTVTVMWDGQAVIVDAEAAGTTPLVGMRLLDDHRLCVDIHDGGRVTIKRRA